MRNDFESGYLMHWGIKKGGKKENHKYYERVEKNGKYLYFYTQAEYEAWLHKGNKALDTTKNKAKGALSSLKSRFSNTKSSLLNAIGKGKSAAFQLANRSQTKITKSNAKQIIDRGNQTISRILSSGQSKKEKVRQEIEETKKKVNQSHPVTDKIYNKLKSFEKVQKKIEPAIRDTGKKIQNKVESAIRKAGKNIQKVTEKYVRDGEKAINKMLNNAGNTKLNSATTKYEKAGSGIISSILMTAAAAVVVTAAKYIIANREEIAEKAKEVFNKIFPPKEDKTKSENKVTEVPPKDFASDTPSSYKEDRAAHSDVPQKKEPTTRDEDMAAINPNFIPEEARQELSKIESEYYKAILTGNEEKAEELYDEYMAISEKYEGYMQNCANCTLAYDLRRRGYDVDASWNPNSTNIDSILEWYNLNDNDVLGVDKGDQKISRSEAKQIEKQLKSMYPEGSYGHMLLYWADGGGHDVVWSIENGKTVIRDCQSNEVVNIEDYLTKCTAMDMFRADDKELTDKAYKVAVADKANLYGDADTDEDYDNYWANHDLYDDNGKAQVKTDQDLNYDKYWKKAAGKKR